MPNVDIISLEDANDVKISRLMGISEPYFSLILSGKKRAEGKKMSPKWNVKIGECIYVYDDTLKNNDNPDWFLALVTNVSKYPGRQVKLASDGSYVDAGALDDMLLFEGIKNMLPGTLSLEDARDIYSQWSSPEELFHYGMQAIELKVIN